MEEFRKIKGYPYEISKYGLIRNIKTGEFKKNYVNSTGYHQCYLGYKRDPETGEFVLNEEGKKIQYAGIVSRLVAEAWIPVPQRFLDKGLTTADLECNHIDENKNHNCIYNLEWVSKKENINHGTRNMRQSYYAKSMSKSHRQKLSEAAKRRGNHKNTGKHIGVQITAPDGSVMEFDSVRKAAKYLNVNPSRIHYNSKSGGDIDGYTFKKLI